ncbi:MAG: membrane protein insertase YidC, partial [Candidatus Wildermuthbacteria bacterium]|nr:membrane protein insertase YidC [Candidatus Wildermuthbacteria bacterium]
MSLIVDFFRTVLFIPLFNALVLLYEYLGDFGLAVVALTLVIRFVLYPLSAKATKAQKRLAELQPRIEEIRAKFKKDRTKLAEATMELYKKEKVNPFASFLPLLLQLPVMIALYQLFWKGFNGDKLNLLYSFISRPEVINTTLL